VEANFLIQLRRTQILLAMNLFASLFQAYPLLSSFHVTEALVSRKRSRLVYKTFILNASNCETATARSSFLYIYIFVCVCFYMSLCVCFYMSLYVYREMKSGSLIAVRYCSMTDFTIHWLNFRSQGLAWLDILSQPHAPAATTAFEAFSLAKISR